MRKLLFLSLLSAFILSGCSNGKNTPAVTSDGIHPVSIGLQLINVFLMLVAMPAVRAAAEQAAAGGM